MLGVKAALPENRVVTRSLWKTAGRIANLSVHVAKRFDADGAFSMASSLSYTSLLSLVPLLAIALAMLTAFPVFDSIRGDLQAMVFRYAVPEVGEQVQQYVTGFISNAGKLTAAGVIGLAFSAIMVLVTIESSFNQIFRVSTPRTPLSRVLVYWTALTLGPLLLGTSFSLSALLSPASDWVARAGLWRIARPLASMLPTVLLMAAFALLYASVPYRRVRVIDALAGGIMAGLAFTALRWGFGLYVANARAYQSVYGAVATVPICLFWMYLSWMVVLSGAELTAALPEWRISQAFGAGPLTARRRLRLALSILSCLFQEAASSGKGKSRLDLLDQAGEKESDMLVVLDSLCAEGYVVQTAAERFVLGRDLDSVTLADLVQLLGLGLASEVVGEVPFPWMSGLAGRLSEAAAAQTRLLDVPLRAILREPPSSSALSADI